MPTTRIKDFTTTTTSAASDDYLALDGLTNGTRKMLGSKLVAAPASTTDNAVVRYDGTAGQVQNSGVTINDSNQLTVSGGLVRIQDATNSFAATVTTASAKTVIASDFGGSSVAIRGGGSLSDGVLVDASNNTTVGGNLTVSGTGGVLLPNNTPYRINNSSGSPINVLKLDASNHAEIVAGAGGSVKLYSNGGSSGLGVNVTSTGTAILGTTTNDNAATGYVGEYVSSTVEIGSAVSLTSGAPSTVTTISLTAGDWDVEGVIYFIHGGSTVGQYYAGGINSATGFPANVGTNSALYGNLNNAFINPNVNIMSNRVSVSGTSTYYLIAQAGFTTSTLTAYGMIRARRVR